MSTPRPAPAHLDGLLVFLGLAFAGVACVSSIATVGSRLLDPATPPALDGFEVDAEVRRAHVELRFVTREATWSSAAAGRYRFARLEWAPAAEAARGDWSSASRGPLVRFDGRSLAADLEGLVPETAYRTRVAFLSAPEGPPTALVEGYGLRTRPAVLFRQPVALAVEPTRVLLHWTTDQPTETRLEFTDLRDGGTWTEEDVEAPVGTLHVMWVRYLEPSTDYLVRAVAQTPDAPGVDVFSDRSRFTTPASLVGAATLDRLPGRYAAVFPFLLTPERKEELALEATSPASFHQRVRALAAWIDEFDHDGRELPSLGPDRHPFSEQVWYLRALFYVNGIRACQRLDELFEVLADHDDEGFTNPLSGEPGELTSEELALEP